MAYSSALKCTAYHLCLLCFAFCSQTLVSAFSRSSRSCWLRTDDLDIYYTLERLVFFTPSWRIPQQSGPRCQKDPNEIRLRTGWWPVAVTTALPVCGEMNAAVCICMRARVSSRQRMYATHKAARGGVCTGCHVDVD